MNGVLPKVVLKQRGIGGFTDVEVDGIDLTRYVSEINLKFVPDSVPTLLLEIPVGDVKVVSHVEQNPPAHSKEGL